MRHALDRPLHLVWHAEGIASPNGAASLASLKPALWPKESGCFPPKGLERIRCFVVPQEEIEAIYYIQEHTAENEPIFVGSNRHDKIFINNVLFYFASKRSSVTKWHEFDPGVQTTIEIQSNIIEDSGQAGRDMSS
jgi:hypothetical protein